jgi:hypothetical protein
MSGYVEQVMDLMKTSLAQLEGVENIVLRSLNPLDPNGTLGIALDGWNPLMWEMGGPGNAEPTTQRYVLSVQHYLKYGSREDGERIHREVAKAVRLMLYRDPDFQVSLRSLSVTEASRKERTLRFNVTEQRYASNETGQSLFLFMSVTTIEIETETVTL